MRKRDRNAGQLFGWGHGGRGDWEDHFVECRCLFQFLHDKLITFVSLLAVPPL